MATRTCRKLLLAIPMALLLGAMVGCSAQTTSDSSQSSSSSSSTSAAITSSSSESSTSSATASSSSTAIDTKSAVDNPITYKRSDEYYKDMESLSKKGGFLGDEMLYLRRIMEISPDDQYMVVSDDLEAGSSPSSYVYFAKDCKFYLNGNPATVKDLKPGYLVGYVPGQVDETFPSKARDTTLVIAWVANQG